MLVAFLIMLREGIEAALIVGIIAGFLKQAGKSQLLPYVWTGVAIAAALCGVIGYVIHIKTGEIPQKQQELWVGIIGLVAVGMLTYMVLWMKKASRHIKQQLGDSVQSALNQGRWQGIALVGMAFLAVAREGLESIFFFIAVMEQAPTWHMPVGAILGIAVAIFIGWLIFQCGWRINLAKFFKFTGVIIIVVAAGLLSGSLRAFHEAGVFNAFQTIAYDWHQILPVDSTVGVLLAGFFGYHDAPTWGEVGAWLLYLIIVLFLFFKQSQPAAAKA